MKLFYSLTTLSEPSWGKGMHTVQGFQLKSKRNCWCRLQMAKLKTQLPPETFLEYQTNLNEDKNRDSKRGFGRPSSGVNCHLRKYFVFVRKKEFVTFKGFSCQDICHNQDNILWPFWKGHSSFLTVAHQHWRKVRSRKSNSKAKLFWSQQMFSVFLTFCNASLDLTAKTMYCNMYFQQLTKTERWTCSKSNKRRLCKQTAFMHLCSYKSTKGKIQKEKSLVWQCKD